MKQQVSNPKTPEKYMNLLEEYIDVCEEVDFEKLQIKELVDRQKDELQKMKRKHKKQIFCLIRIFNYIHKQCLLYV